MSRPTFPLPDEDLRKEKLRVLFASPLVWGPQIAVVGLGLHLGWRLWILGAVMLAVFFVCALVWQARSGTLERKITRRIIERSNAGQDEQLLSKVRELEARGADSYAITLGKHVELKQQIESILHADAKLTDREKEVEKMVDSLCFGIADHLAEASDLDAQMRSAEDADTYERLRSAQRKLLAQVIEGFKSLKQTKARLSRRKRIAQPSPERSGIDLDAILADLRSEEEIARNTRARLRKDSVS